MMTGVTEDPEAHYQEPGWFTRNIFNRFVAFLTRARRQRVGLPRAPRAWAHLRGVAHHTRQSA